METPSIGDMPDLYVPDNPELTEQVQLQQADAMARDEALQSIDIGEEESFDQFQGMFADEQAPEELNYYPDVRRYSIPNNIDEVAGQAAYVETLLSGEDFNEAFENHKATLTTNTPQETQALVNESLGRAYEEDAEAAYSEALSNGDVAGASDAVSYLTTAGQVPFEDNFVSLISTATSSPVQQKMLANNLRIYNRLSEVISSVQEQVTGWDMAGSILNTIVPGHANRVFNEMAERVLEREIDWDSVANIDIVNDLRDTFLSLPVEERLDFIDVMLAAAESESGLFTTNYQEVLTVFSKFQDATAEELTTENIWAAVDVAGLSIPSLIKGTVKGLIKTHAVVKNSSSTATTVEKAGNTKLAAQTVATDILEDTSMSGLSDGEKVSKALSFGENPLTMEGGVLAGASDEVKQALRDFAIKREVQQIITEKGHTGLSAEDVQNIVTKWDKEYLKASNPHFKSHTLKDADDLGATYDVVINDPTRDGGFISERAARAFAEKNGFSNFELEEVIEGPWKAWNIKGEYRRPFTVEDIPAMDVGKGTTGFLTDKLPNFLAFPAQVLNFDRIATAARNVHKEATTRNNFKRLWDDAFKGVKGTSKQKVLGALQKGDVEQRVLGESELHELGLKTNERLAYYKVRTIRDISYMAHNKAIVDNLSFRGFTRVAIQGTDEIPAFETAGKTYTKEEANKLYKTGENTGYNIASGEIIPLTKESLERIYADGGVITRIAHPEDMKGIKHDIIITRADDVVHSPLTTALPYRPGEIARSYADDWFIYAPTTGYKNGKKGTFNTTVRTSPSFKDAEKWAAAHNVALKAIRAAEEEGIAGITKTSNPELYREALVRKADESLAEYGDSTDFVDAALAGDYDITKEFGVKFDREVPHGAAQGEQIEAMFSQGKLFTGQRSEHLKNVYGDDAPIQSIQDSLAREMSYVSKFTSLSTWRETQLEQILNTFGHALPEGVSKYEKALLSEPHPGILSTREKKYLQRLREHVKTRIGIPTKEALDSKENLIEFSKALEGVGLDKTARLVAGFKDTTPAQALRTAVFHSYLGMFNIQQFIVQANGAAIAASVHPIHGLKAGFSYPVIRTAMIFDSVGNTKALDAMIKSTDFTTIGMSGKEDLLETIELVRKSGILNDIKSSALYHVKEGAVDLEGDSLVYGANIASRSGAAIRDGAKKAIDAGLEPFRRGEEAARIIALDIARREWKKLNPGKSVTTRQAVNEIVTLQDKYTLGMTKGNMGQVQQGWAAVPFQFAQWNLKFAESLLGKTFTPGEKARMFGIGSILYGAEGTAGYMGVDWVLGELLGEDVTNTMTPEQKLAYTQGAISWAIGATTDAEVAVGERIGPASYFTDMYEGLIGSKTTLEMISGAPGSFLAKEYEAFNEIYRVFFEGSDTLGYGDALEAINIVAKGASSGYNNFSKYYLAMKADGYLKTKTGQKITQISDTEAIFGMFGLHPNAVSETFKMSASTREVDVLISDLAKDYETLWRRYYEAPDKTERDRIYAQITARKEMLKTDGGEAIADRAWQRGLKRSRKDMPLYIQYANKIQDQVYREGGQAVPSQEEMRRIK